MRNIGTVFLLFASGLIMVGFFWGSSMSDSDWLSPITNTAKAHQIEAQTQLDARQRILELDHLEKSLAQKLEFERAQLERDLTMREIGFTITLGVGSGAVLALTAALVYYLVCRGQLAQAERARQARVTKPPLRLVRPSSRRDERYRPDRSGGTSPDGDQAA